MAMVAATPDPLTASVILETDYSGVNKGTIWRYIGNVATEVRGYVLKETGQEVPPFRDYEAPLGVSVGYSELNWTGTKPAAPNTPQVYATLNVADTTGWIKFPARPELNFPIECITALPERKFGGNSETFRVIGRSKPIAIHDVMTWWEGDIEWVAPTLNDHERQVNLITTGTICMLQTMPAYGAISEFALVEDLETAHVGAATRNFPQRFMTMSFVTIAEPVGTYTVEVAYTYTALKADWANYGTVKTNYDNYFNLYLNVRG